MAVIEPFRGVRYNPEKVEDLNLVMAPPYDIIQEKLQNQLYEKHPYNVIRLELSRETTKDTKKNNRYTRSGAYLKNWRDEKILIQDEQPALYVYFLDYVTRDGEKKTQKGFLSIALLEELDSGVVFPHENTLSGPKADRLRLMEACHANFSAIFSLYSNPEMEIVRILDETATASPLMDVRDMDQVRHRVWPLCDSEKIRRIQKIMADLPLFIADGHHRYETALSYRNRMREKTGKRDGRQGFDYVMMYFSNMEEPGLTIYPTHRLIDHLQEFELRRYLKRIESYFQVRRFPFLRKKEFLRELKTIGGEKHAFGLYTTESDDLFLLILHDMDRIRSMLRPELSPVLRKLDVTILHTVLLEGLLGIGEEELKAQTHVRYVKEIDDALNAVNDREVQLAFLLNGTRVEHLREVSLKGEKMPQKSTYFYPKLLTGLVLNPLD